MAWTESVTSVCLWPLIRSRITNSHTDCPIDVQIGKTVQYYVVRKKIAWLSIILIDLWISTDGKSCCFDIVVSLKNVLPFRFLGIWLRLQCTVSYCRLVRRMQNQWFHELVFIVYNYTARPFNISTSRPFMKQKRAFRLWSLVTASDIAAGWFNFFSTLLQSNFSSNASRLAILWLDYQLASPEPAVIILLTAQHRGECCCLTLASRTRSRRLRLMACTGTLTTCTVSPL